MLKYIEEFDKHVLIAGLRGVKEDPCGLLEIFNNKKRQSIEIQFFDAVLIASWEHLYFSLLNALTSFRNNRNISKSLAMETMLYSLAQHQISKATKLIGIKPDTRKIAVLIVGDSAAAVESVWKEVLAQTKAIQDDTVVDLTEKKMRAIKKAFAICDSELTTIMKKGNAERALTELVIERMALLATQH